MHLRVRTRVGQSMSTESCCGLIGLSKTISFTAKKLYAWLFWCFNQGVNLENRQRETDEQLCKILTHLEESKQSLDLQDEDKKICEHFAMRVFLNAEKKDSEGLATTDIAKAYYAASIFFEVGHTLWNNMQSSSLSILVL